MGGAAKLVRFGQWNEALRVYRLPSLIARTASLAVPIAELTVVALLILDRARAGAALTLTLLAMFSLALLNARQHQGDRLPCGCFGRATPHDYRLLVARNGALACLAAIVLVDGRDGLVTGSLRTTSNTLLPALLVLVGLSLVLWVGRGWSQAMHRQ
jgi:hypothetical protein